MKQINNTHQLIALRNALVFIALIVTFGSCKPKSALNRFSDPELRKIFTYQYNRQSDSLYPYFTHSNPEYRKEAALSFSSIGDTTSLEHLYPLLKDADTGVRKAAAFSIGQSKNTKAVDELVMQSKIETDSHVNQFILEAIGRCANNKALEYLVSYFPKDSIEKTGVAWGIYRACRRNVVSKTGTNKVAGYLSMKEAFEVTLASAFYFYHSKESIDPYLSDIIALADNSRFIEVRMAAVRALRNSAKSECADFLIKTLNNAKDYRLQVDAINTLKFFPYQYCKNHVWDALHNNNNVSVKIAAAEYFELSKNKTDYNQYIKEAENTSNWRIRALMLKAAIGTGVKNPEVSNLLQRYYSGSTDICEKQLLLSALAEDNNNLDFITTAFKKESYGEILFSFSEALLKIRTSKDFKKQDEQNLASFFVNLLNSDNKYLVIQGLSGIMTPEYQVKKYFPDTRYLQDAKQKARSVFDKNNISYQLFDLALEYYTLTEPESIKLLNKKIYEFSGYSTPTFKPVDWKSISAIPENAKVLVETAKGNFVIQLLVNETPFTVNAFLDGVKNKLFDSLRFYRVVPDFVNQTGGTTDFRKDSLANLRIRSEYNIRRHREGTVNMASNGRDTETSHFSIMLCPTPWNDNSYTIFGMVVEGMDIVNKIELSDYILSMSMMN